MKKQVRLKRDLPGTILAEGITVGTDMYKTQLNNNIAVFGVSDAGKTDGPVKSNIMQMNSSYVVTDPKGNLYDELAPMLCAAGYEVKLLDLVNPERSNGYNPFECLRSDEDIDFFVEALIASTGRWERDPFWDDSTAVLLKALIGWLLAWHEETEEDQPITMRELIALLDRAFSPASGHYVNCRNALDDAFELLRNGFDWEDDELCQTSEGRCGDEYKTWLRFKQLAPADVTTACVYMEAAGKLTRLANSGVLSILDGGSNPIQFESIGTRKTALFVVVSDMDRSLDFLTSIFYTQLFKELCRVADGMPETGYRLPVPVRVILDDFANQAPIPNFDTIIAAVRSRDIWITVICQATAQLEARYGVAAQTIIGCCDTVMYLGVNDIATARELSERADMPVSEVQSLPIGQVMIFRRGSACQIAQRFKSKNHVNAKWLKSEEGLKWADRHRRLVQFARISNERADETIRKLLDAATAPTRANGEAVNEYSAENRQLALDGLDEVLGLFSPASDGEEGQRPDYLVEHDDSEEKGKCHEAA